MKKIFFAAAFAAALVCGCAKESLQNDASDEVILSANLPEESTKTAVGAADNQYYTKVVWSAGDKLSVWGGENNEFSIVGEAGTTSGSFSGSITTGAALYAMYPYQAEATGDKGTITMRVPNTQTAPEGSFDPAAAVMVGTISGSTITFKNVMAYLRITAPLENVDNLLSITVESNSVMTGDAKFNASTGRYSATGLGCKFVTVKPAEGKFKGGRVYFAAVIPGTFTGGLTLKYLYKDAANYKLVEYSKSNTTDLTVAAGHVKTLNYATLSYMTSSDKARQLWEDGPYWAIADIGATSASEDGLYFAWGYEEGCVRNSDNTGWVLASDNKTVKQFNSTYFPDRSQADFKDAAAANLGSGWSLPTYDEVDKLINKCENLFPIDYFAIKGIGACNVNAIDFYRHGKGVDDSLLYTDIYGYYMCYPTNCMYIDIGGEYIRRGLMNYPKSTGISIRPVYRIY